VRDRAITVLPLAASLLAPALVLAAVWFPIVRHYHARTPVVTDNMIESGRQSPSDTLLHELSSYYFFGTGVSGAPVEVAERLLQGQVTLRGEAPQRVRLPFDPDELDQGPVTWRLFHARLTVPRILIAAYRQTGRDDFLRMARDAILAWASYEQRTVVPKGLLWNDHGIAERVQVLSEFWSVYRHHPNYDAAVARQIFRFVARSGRFLADSSQFTASTNHGAMQNLALLHLSLAFPTLPESPTYSRLALERLGEQMLFYVSDEGVVLEHSAGYQRFGVQVLGTALRYLSLQGLPIPAEWRIAYDKAKAAYSLLRRPDGTLPLFGDTDGVPDEAGPPVTAADEHGGYAPLIPQRDWRPGQSYTVFPVSGYAIWWHGLAQWPRARDLSQTVVAWSSFPSQVHKHADEMSVLFWAGGRSWWTNVGYWPYGTERGDGEGWNGSNAPHLTGEDYLSRRTTRLVRSWAGEQLTFVDLERNGPNGYRARREVLCLSGRHWIVIDHISGVDSARSTTVWTTAPEIEMSAGESSGSYRLRDPASHSELTVFLLGSPGLTVQQLRGSYAPFAGWQVVETPQPASAILLEQPAGNSWAAVVWSRPVDRPAGQASMGVPAMEAWQGPGDWRLSLPSESGLIRVVRKADTLLLSDPGEAHPTRIALTAPAVVDSQIAAIHRAYKRVADKYPRFQDELPYRFKVTYLIVVLLVLQEIVFAAFRRISRRHSRVLRAVAAGGWVIVGLYLLVVRVRLI